MKELVLTALIAMQLTVASAAQPRYSDTDFNAEDSPSWSCMLRIASDQKDQQKANESQKQADEEPDCE